MHLSFILSSYYHSHGKISYSFLFKSHEYEQIFNVHNETKHVKSLPALKDGLLSNNSVKNMSKPCHGQPSLWATLNMASLGLLETEITKSRCRRKVAVKIIVCDVV